MFCPLLLNTIQIISYISIYTVYIVHNTIISVFCVSVPVRLGNRRYSEDVGLLLNKGTPEASQRCIPKEDFGTAQIQKTHMCLLII